MATWAQLGTQDGTSPLMEEMIYFHDLVLVILSFILSVISLSMLALVKSVYLDKHLLEGQLIECAWTLIPAAILIQIGVPSLLLLYMLDESFDNSISVKAVGHQWYWAYEYSDFWSGTKLEFDSYITRLTEAAPRLLDSDSRLILPACAHIRVMLTSADVLHCWTVPALGVKADACPGRLNQVKFISQRSGVFFGQCSEICGANHSFMPIALELVSPVDFISWVKASS